MVKEYVRGSGKNSVIAGVCYGLAEYFGIDKVIVRAFGILLLGLTPIPTLCAYLFLVLTSQDEQSLKFEEFKNSGYEDDKAKENTEQPITPESEVVDLGSYLSDDE